MSIDFSPLARSLLAQARTLLPQWLPAGRWRGHEFVVGNLRGEAGDSLAINANTGMWADFAAGDKGGDLISLYAAIHGVRQMEAARLLDDGSIARQIEASPRSKPEARRALPTNSSTPPCTCVHYKFGVPSRIWTYRDAQGAILGYIARYDPEGERKQIVPWTWGTRGDKPPRWEAGGWPRPRPLYGLEHLAARPEAPVMIVEGEKACDAAREIAPQYVVVTWPGGVQSIGRIDWTPLAGRSILLWPDADDPGVKAMWEIGHTLRASSDTVKIIMPDFAKGEGWDAADALGEGWDWSTFKAWAVPRAKHINDGGDHDGRGSEGNPAGEAGHGEAPGDTAYDEGEDRVLALAAEAERLAGASHEHLQPGGAPGAGDDRAAQADRGAAAGSRPHVQPARADGEGVQRAHRDAALEANTPSSSRGISVVQRWMSWGLDVNGHGTPLSNLNNAVHVMQNDPKLVGHVWTDDFLHRLMTGDPYPREWADADDIRLNLYIQRVLKIERMSLEIVRQAVKAVADGDHRNCAREWMRSLVWDGTPRITTFFEDTMGAPSNEFVRAVSHNFWIMMVARVMQPGCKVDNMVVLEGPQGRFKSTALNIIAGEWFAEQHESATNPKAFAEILQGKLIVEISEMNAFSRAEVSRVKQTITCVSDRFRDSYGHKAADHKRQCILVGTVNKDDWNRDETGARRFWPVRCNGHVRVDLITALRAQYFAEAVRRFDEGETWWKVPEEEARREQDERFSDDPWLDAIAAFVRRRDFVLVSDIAEEVLRLDLRDFGKYESDRVISCLRWLGWMRSKQRRVGGRVIRGWERDVTNQVTKHEDRGDTEKTFLLRE